MNRIIPILAIALTVFAMPAWCAQEQVSARAYAADEGPKLDGKLDDEVWQQAEALPLRKISGEDQDLKTTARVVIDATHLYVGFDCAESASAIQQDAAQRDGNVWKDDCVEIFVSVDPEAGYKHFAVNAHGTVFDQECPPRGGNKPGWNSGAKAAGHFEPGKGWTVELSVPLADLGALAGGGQTWTFNVNRTRPSSGGRGAQEYSWANLVGTDFHQPGNFGQLGGVRVKEGKGILPRIQEVPKFAFAWAVHPDIRAVTGIFPHPSDPDRVWCTTESGLFESRDNGNTFVAVEAASEEKVGRVACLAASPGYADVLVLGTRDRGLFVSRDGGKTFEAAGKVTDDQPPADPLEGMGYASASIATIHFSEVDHAWQTLLVGHGDAAAGVSISRDLGRTWWVFARDRSFYSFAQSGDTLVAAGAMSESAGRGASLQRTIDGGQRWNEFERGVPFTGGDFGRLKPDRFVFCAKDGKVLLSTDDGIRWRNITPKADGAWASAFYTYARDAKSDLLVLYDPFKYGVLFGDGLRPAQYLDRNQGLYIGRFIKSGALCRANANGAVLYILQSGRLWTGRPAPDPQGPNLVRARCEPSQLALGAGKPVFTVMAEVRHPKGAGAVKEVVADLSIMGLHPRTELFDDGAHGDGAAGDGLYAAQAELPKDFAWKFPEKDRRVHFGPVAFNVAVSDKEKRSSTLPALLHVFEPPGELMLWDGSQAYEGFFHFNKGRSQGDVKHITRARKKEDPHPLMFEAKIRGPWLQVFGATYKTQPINLSGYRALAFRVKGTVHADFQVALWDNFTIDGETMDDVNFSRQIGCVSGGYLKDLKADYQDVEIPIHAFLPPGQRFIRKYTAGLAFGLPEGAPPGTYCVDKIRFVK